jgi:group I intron endonuclease
MAESQLNTSGIYVIWCIPSGKYYVGSALDLTKRWFQHRHDLERNKHKSPRVQHAWNKYGADAFLFEVIELVEPARLIEVEQSYLDRTKATNRRYGLNTCPTAGSRYGTRTTPETRAKMSAAAKGKIRTAEHRANLAAALLGKPGTPWSEESRANHLAAMLNKPPVSDETRAKLRAMNLGVCRPHRPETRAKMSNTRRGRPHSPEHSAAISAAKMGHTHSDECRAKIAATLRGSKLSPETIAKREATRLRNRLAREAAKADETHSDHSSGS